MQIFALQKIAFGSKYACRSLSRQRLHPLKTTFFNFEIGARQAGEFSHEFPRTMAICDAAATFFEVR
jgi:hypothetical protein